MATNSKIEWTEMTWNPVTGCSKVSEGCRHCLTLETPILYEDFVWRPIGDAKPGDRLLGFDERSTPGHPRKFRASVIEAVWSSRQPTRRLITRESEVITTASHRWLRHGSPHWPTTDCLRVGKPLRQIGVTPAPPVTDDYRIGYLAGMTLGDGTFRFTPGQRSDKLGYPQAYWRVALKEQDEAALGRLVAYLAHFGLRGWIRPFSAGTDRRQPMKKVEIRALDPLDRLYPLLTIELSNAEYARGFLAGFFDAEGSGRESLRMSQVDTTILERVRAYGARLGFRFDIEGPAPMNRASNVRLFGSALERLMFLSTIQPALVRKAGLIGIRQQQRGDPVMRVERGPVAEVVDIQTSTRTFFAAGLATHNCYAERMAKRLKAMGNARYANGFKVTLHDDLVDLPRRMRASRVIFVNSMSDLFHEKVPTDFIRRVFDTMNACPQHTFQVLTKRSQRLRELAPDLPWPYHIWIGVSVEDRRVLNRIADLRTVPAEVRFLSCEPLIGPLDALPLNGISWVILGGESGPGARPMEKAWVESIRRQCRSVDVRFFFKQWGGARKDLNGRELDGRTYDEMPPLAGAAVVCQSGRLPLPILVA